MAILLSCSMLARPRPFALSRWLYSIMSPFYEGCVSTGSWVCIIRNNHACTTQQIQNSHQVCITNLFLSNTTIQRQNRGTCGTSHTQIGFALSPSRVLALSVLLNHICSYKNTKAPTHTLQPPSRPTTTYAPPSFPLLFALLAAMKTHRVYTARVLQEQQQQKQPSIRSHQATSRTYGVSTKKTQQ